VCVLVVDWSSMGGTGRFLGGALQGCGGCVLIGLGAMFATKLVRFCREKEGC